jgi:hypothetical protein
MPFLWVRCKEKETNQLFVPLSPHRSDCVTHKIDKLAVHLKYFCGETAQRTEAQSRQRRTADRHPDQPSRGGRGTGGGGGGGSSNARKKPFISGPSKKKAPTTKVAAKKPLKKTVRARKVKDYDSDSDLSMADDVDLSTSKRPSRSAARTAVKRMNVSSKDWAGSDSDSDAFTEGSDASSDDDGSDYGAAPTSRLPPKKNIRTSPPPGDSDDSSDEDDSEDEAAIARATKRQKLAYEQAKNSKKKEVTVPKKSPKSSTKFKAFKKNSAGKPILDDSSADDDADDDDPLRGVDMDALREEALQGCQPSVLHTMSWWRVVLDEAHMIKSRSSQTASAAFHLSAVHRWALSGTPLQVSFEKNPRLGSIPPDRP